MSAARDELIGDVDLALAALRRVIVRAIDAGEPPRKPIQEKPALPVATKKVIASQPPTPKPIAIEKRPPAEANGVFVDFAISTVSFNGKSVVVPARQANVVAVLARAIPHVIPRAEIARRAWLDLSASSGEIYVAALIKPLTESLAGIGLTLKVIPKFGLALMPAESTS